MNNLPASAVLPTVSYAFLADWLAVLRENEPSERLDGFLARIGLAGGDQPRGRVTHDQIVQLYQYVARETGDEMMGLWSRPIRQGSLKHLCASVRGASSLPSALFRFSSFWNLLLDDYQIALKDEGAVIRVTLHPAGPCEPHRFGHMLLLKLTHGVASWLAGRELPLVGVNFAFARPGFAEDYPVLFPAPVRFDARHSSILFDGTLRDLSGVRSDAETRDFLRHAPRDWIFTNLREHALPLRVRELIQGADHLAVHLGDAAQALNMTPRTLMRRLDRDGTSFQAIKDGLRRDIAIRDLTRGDKSIEAISQDTGFASSANFHRAFKRWTDLSPGAYRRMHRRS